MQYDKYKVFHVKHFSKMFAFDYRPQNLTLRGWGGTQIKPLPWTSMARLKPQPFKTTSKSQTVGGGGIRASKGEGWARGSAQSHNAPTPYSLGIGSTAPRGLRGGRPTWQDRRAEGCGSRYNDSFPDERVRVFCSEFVTAARALCGVRSSTEVLRCAPDDNS